MPETSRRRPERHSSPPPGATVGDRERGAQRAYRTILSQELDTALREFDRPSSGLFLSSLSAGLDIGFGPLLMAVYLTITAGQATGSAQALILAGLYSVGFLIVIIGRSELFTEHTSLAILPVLSGRAKATSLARVWSIVLIGNVIGTAVIAWLIARAGPGLGIVDEEALASLAEEMTDTGSMQMLISAVLAGWMMGLVSWLVAAARETISQIFLIVIVTASIGLIGLHHSVAGSVEVLFGVFGGSATLSEYLRFMLLAVAGNTLGGTVFVALLKYGHVSRSQPEEEEQEFEEAARLESEDVSEA